MNDKKDQGMQAVLIADNTKTSFGFIQSQSSTSLMPVANTPLLAYTIEFLIFNNISQLIIFAYEHKKEISEFIDTQNSLDIKIKLIKCSERPSVTSAIKDLDNMDLLKGDFLLVNSHVITNIDISKAIAAHNERKAKEVPMLMTKCFTKVTYDSKLRNPQDLVTVVSNNLDRQILKYENMERKRKCKVNQFFEFKQKKHYSLNVQMDLLDCDIDIVNQSIIGILEDFANFEQFKSEFINHVTESEIITDKVYFHEISGLNYLSRVNNAQVYFQTCMDVLQRESYPISPGANIDTHSLMEYNNIIINFQDNVNFKGMNEKLGAFCVGEHSSIGANTVIENSCIGTRCNIAENCEISECIIWDQATIQKNCELQNCIITHGVSIESNTQLSNVLIMNENGKLVTHDISFKYRKVSEELGHDTDESNLIEEESDEEVVQKAEHNFDDEIRAIVMRQITEGHPIESIKVEINTVRFSDNKNLADCLVAIVPPLIDSVMVQKDMSIQDSIKALDKLFMEYSDLLKGFIVTKNEQACLIECIEKC